MDKIAECLDLSFPPNNVDVVPNAVDKKSVCSASEGIEEKFLQYKGWIICVGRIEPRKNQLSLLKAIKDSDFHLLLVGKPSLNYKHYFKIEDYTKLYPHFTCLYRSLTLKVTPDAQHMPTRQDTFSCIVMPLNEILNMTHPR